MPTVHFYLSAGVGRTGVIIGVDIGMHYLEEEGKVDILGIVSSMRQDRGGMVQTLGQYVFIHEVRVPSCPFASTRDTGESAEINT